MIFCPHRVDALTQFFCFVAAYSAAACNNHLIRVYLSAFVSSRDAAIQKMAMWFVSLSVMLQ